MSLRHASHVPKSNPAFGARSGPDLYMSIEEEVELSYFLIQVAKIGYPHTKKQVLALVQRMLLALQVDFIPLSVTATGLFVL